MLRQGCLLVILLLAILIMIPIVASHYVPSWAMLLIIVGEIVGMRYLIPLAIRLGILRFARSMINAKSQVLRGARVHVHRVETAPPPEDASDRRRLESHQPVDSDAAGEATLIGAIPADDRYVLVEFTLTPRSASGQNPMQFYDPSEFLLVPFDHAVPNSPTDDSEDDDTQSAGVVRVRQLDDHGGEHEIDKITGVATLVATFSIPPTLNGRVKFRYYFETFGDFLLPT